MYETKKSLRTLSGIFILLEMGISIILTTVFGYLPMFTRWKELSPDQFESYLKSFLVTSSRDWVIWLLMFVTAIFILGRKFPAAGILQAISALISFVFSIISFVSLSRIASSINIFTWLNTIVGVVSILATIFFAIALFVKGRSGKLFCILSAIIGIITTLLSSAFSLLISGGISISQFAVVYGGALIGEVIPMILLFLAKIFLGTYFKANENQ